MKAIFWSEISSTMMRQLNFKAVSNCALLLLALLADPAPVTAAVITFSFDNVNGAIGGTVSGEITLPDGDGTGLVATSLVITSAPAALGYTTPFDVFTLMAVPSPRANSFDVSGGQINMATSVFFRLSEYNAFGLNYATFGSFLTPIASLSPPNGVQDAANTTLTYGTAPVPISGTVALLGLGLVGIGAARRKQA